ncbi:hypothetical protein [Nocardia sp. NPDC046763]|uniref:hypothetical protein n=1 Tax=unclassified Nocardia TaxID=2637762 RepID=UPI0033D84E52
MATQQQGKQPEHQRSWVDDDCQNGSIHPITRARAKGISAIHANCEPPCPRAESARKYLKREGIHHAGTEHDR